MTYTALPSIKGQVTIPPALRKKYHISKETPLVIQDAGDGMIKIKVMRLIPDSLIQYYENEDEFGLRFKHGIDPALLVKAIKEIDG